MSAGAVTKDVDSPLRERIAEPVHSLGTLQERLRTIQPLPREETLSEETGPVGSAAPPPEQAEVDQAGVAQVVAQPQQQPEADADTMGTTTDTAAPAAAESDEQPDSLDAE